VSIMAPSGESLIPPRRPGRPVSQPGTAKRTRDLAMWAAWQGGVGIGEIAREFRLDRTTVWRRIRLVRKSGAVHGETRRVG
jgi:Mor family transcriptional regulator